MRDDDAGEIDPSSLDDIVSEHVLGHSSDLFGGYSILSPGVQIVLDGRTVSNFSS